MNRQNIIFCHVDQMHWNALSGLGNPHLQTPHLDRMHAMGTSFSNHWSANPICCPARACWYTGTPSYTNDTLGNNVAMRADLPDLGQWMSARGYDCYYAGKWHVPARDVKQSFKVLDYGSPRAEALDSSVTRTAVGFLNNYKEEKPFFLNLGYLNPHDCCYLDIIKGGYATKLGLEKKLELPPLPKTATAPPRASYSSTWNEDQRRLYIWYYYRMMEMVDAEVGTVFKALENSRFADNTTFIFTADHGEMLMEHNETKKGGSREAATRVPLLVIGPEVRQGICDTRQISGGTDVTATILDLAGIEVMPEMTDTISLLPALVDDIPRLKEYVVSESYNAPKNASKRTVYFDDHKVVCDRYGKRFLVHDFVNDKYELNELSQTDAGKAAILKAEAYLGDWAKLHKPCPRIQKNPEMMEPGQTV